MTIFLEFLVLGAIVVFGAIKLAGQAEIIEDNSKMNAALIGIILALTTSLPEFATSITSTIIGQPQMAIGNILGSNAFNFLVLCSANIIFYKQVIFNKIDKASTRINIFTAIMYILFLVAFYTTAFGTNTLLFGRVTLTSIGILVTYIFAIRITSSVEEGPDEDHTVDEKAYTKAKINFVIYAVIILIASINLAKSAFQIVAITGLNASVVGAIFIGISTSLPELMTCFSLVKSGNYSMAATSIWGSNLFNFLILTVVDIISSQPLLTKIDSDLLSLAFIGIAFTIIHFIQANLGFKNKVANIIPSIVMIGIYVVFFIF